jgi:pimeloyl-ACP methyl ester carboxylesterase
MKVHYANSEGVALAYGVQSESGPPLIYTPGVFSHLAFDDNAFFLKRFHEGLASFSRLVRWDRRGTGLSDQTAEPLPLAGQCVDLDAVRAAAGIERAALVGHSHGGALAAFYAAAHPERVSHLVIIDSMVDANRNPYEPADTSRFWDALVKLTESDPEGWVSNLVRAGAPGMDEALLAEGVRSIQSSISPSSQRQLIRILVEIDVREVLSRVRVPTLVAHATRETVFLVEHGRYLAEHIEGARLLELDSDCHMIMADPAASSVLLAAIEEFVTGSVGQTAARSMASVLFTDIVDSAARQRALGDDAWRALRETFERNTRRIVEAQGGRVVQFTGDGVMAAFGTPSQALRAAKALGADARGLGVAIRAGVHTGEVYEVEDQLFGACVTVAARVAAQAEADELLTTETVQDLVAGAGLEVRDAGLHELKGLGERRLVAAL